MNTRAPAFDGRANTWRTLRYALREAFQVPPEGAIASSGSDIMLTESRVLEAVTIGEPRVVERADRIVIVMPLSAGFRALSPIERRREIEAALADVNDRLAGSR